MGVCEPLMPDVVTPKVHHNNRSYSADLPSDLAWWAVTQRTSKNHKLSKLRGGHLRGYDRLPGTIRYSSHVET